MEEERAVVVEGSFLGRIVKEFNLSSLLPSMLGSDAFTEVYIDTESGNQYLIYRPMNEYEQRGNDWFMLNAKNLTRIPMSKGDMEKGLLKVGGPFTYNNGGRTKRVTKITCVNTQRRYVSGYFKGVEVSDVRNSFATRRNMKIDLYI